MHVHGDTAPTEAVYRHVQGLSRGLRILRALNEAEMGEATPRELSDTTRLNRTTVKRILETLAEEGYVRSCEAEGRYGIAPGVVALSRGMTEDARLLTHGVPIMKQLGRDTGWSLRITTPRDDRMVIRDSTHPTSQLAFEEWGGLRCSLPILLTAAGRAFFANCDDAARHDIVDTICRHRSEQSSLAGNTRLVDQLTRRVLDDGYALNDGDWGQRRLGAVALPIHGRDGRPLASLSLLYTRKAVSQATIETEFVPALRRSVGAMRAAM